MSKKSLLTLGLISMMSVTGCTSAAEQSKMQVYINDGAIQCFGGGVSKEQTAKQLMDQGIEVYDSTCGTMNGMVTIAACGGSTLSINVHSINLSKLKQAEALGFKSVATLKEGFTEGCKERSAKVVE